MNTQATRFGSCPFRRPLQAAVLLLLTLLPTTVSAQLTTEPSVAFSYTTWSGVRRIWITRGGREFWMVRRGGDFTVTQTSSIVGDNLVWSCDVTYVNPRTPGQPRSFWKSINHGQRTNVVLTEGVARHFSGSVRGSPGLFATTQARALFAPPARGFFDTQNRRKKSRNIHWHLDLEQRES